MATVRKHTEPAPPPLKAPKLRLYRNDFPELENTPTLLRFPGAVLGDLIFPDVLARQACFWGGLVFGVVGALESFYPGISGPASLSRYHGFFYLLAGALLTLPALMLPPRRLQSVSTFFGFALAAIAFFGFLLGAGTGNTDRFYWAALPGTLEFGTKDHILLGSVGLLLMLASVRTRTGLGYR